MRLLVTLLCFAIRFSGFITAIVWYYLLADVGAQNVAISAEGRGFESQAGQIGHSVAKWLPRAIYLQICVIQVLSADMAPPLVTRFGVIPRVW